MKSSLRNPDPFFAADIYDIAAAVVHDIGDGFSREYVPEGRAMARGGALLILQ